MAPDQRAARGRVRRPLERRQVVAAQPARAPQGVRAREQHAGPHARDQLLQGQRHVRARRPAGLRLREDLEGRARRSGCRSSRGTCARPPRCAASCSCSTCGTTRRRTISRCSTSSREIEAPTIVVLTKIDKLRPREVPERVHEIAVALRLEDEQMIPFSAETNQGRDELAVGARVADRAAVVARSGRVASSDGRERAAGRQPCGSDYSHAGFPSHFAQPAPPRRAQRQPRRPRGSNGSPIASPTPGADLAADRALLCRETLAELSVSASTPRTTRRPSPTSRFRSARGSRSRRWTRATSRSSRSSTPTATTRASSR